MHYFNIYCYKAFSLIAVVKMMASISNVTDPTASFVTQEFEMNSGRNDFSSGEEYFKYIL